MRLLVAFDKFKDALSAAQAGAVAAREIKRLHPDWTIDGAPLTDGGDGFADVLMRAAAGETVPVRASGPRGGTLEAALGRVAWRRVPAAARTRLALPNLREDDRIAVVEMASASGLARLAPAERDPWHTTTFGTGQLLRAAAELETRAVVLGVGGSATNDLGLGALAALGFEFRDAANARLRPPTPALWPRLERIEGALFDSIPPIRIACDVANPLLGPRGAAAVFGPQKGLAAGDIARLDAEAARVARLLCAHCGAAPDLAERPGTGAAGGLPFGLLAAGRTQLVPGFELVRAWLDLDARLAWADLVITGEGRFDATSLGGKGPGALVQAAVAAGKPVVVFAGAIGVLPANALPAAVDLRAISPPELPLAQALRETPDRLAAAVREKFAARGT